MFKSITVSSRGDARSVVVGVFNDKQLDPRTASLDRQLGGVISEAMKRPEFTGDAGRIVEAFPAGKRTTREGRYERVYILGLGKKSTFKVGALRSAAGALGRRLAQTKEGQVAIEIVYAFDPAKVEAHAAGRCLGEGLGLIGWWFDEFKGKASEPDRRVALAVRSSSKAFEAGLEQGLELATSTNFARDLSQTPPNVATTTFMADQARKLARQSGMSCKVFEGADLVRERFEGLINVGKASDTKPCLIRLEYKPRTQKKGVKPIVLVGKTMTYDSGGLSLKINNGMVGMKRDKDGGCAVLGAMHAIANYVKPNRPVVALLACAENSISDNAYRPDDVIRYRNGVTVEVTNTDAEGRLVLADALCWACEKEDPACIIDLATLTGGVVTALGSTFAGLWCDHDPLRGRLEQAMATSGERWWRLPHDAEYRDMMKSPIADILNSNPNRKAHPIQGAAFLSYFVKPEIPWCHIDIAGVHAVEGDTGPFCKGPTGWGVRLLADFVADDGAI